MPNICGARLTRHFGSKPTSVVGVPAPAVPLAIAVMALAASVKSGFVPSGAVKSVVAPTLTRLVDQPEVGWFWMACEPAGAVPVPTITLFLKLTFWIVTPPFVKYNSEGLLGPI